MSLISEARSLKRSHDAAPLNRALGQSERVQDKVEKAASDLDSVNAVLKDEMAEAAPPPKVGEALNRSEAVAVEVQQAADELVAVNTALADEIDERKVLEQRLTESDAALAASRSGEAESRHNALHDGLTGLPNLELFKDRLRNAIAQAHRHGWRLAVMFIDLDNFKNVNDSHGHDAGDTLLRAVGKRLQGSVRGGDTVGRRSGDEFLLLMLEAKDEANVAAFAARILADIAPACEVEGESLSVNASVGIALYPEDGRSVEELLRHADLAMYAAKKNQSGVAFISASKHLTAPGRRTR